MKTKVITIKVSMEELSSIQTEAERANMTKSELIRRKMLDDDVIVVDHTAQICGGLCRLEQALSLCGQQDNKGIRKEMDTLWQCLKK